MKTKFGIVLCLAFLAAFSTQAYATPMVYTAEGVIKSLNDNGTGILSKISPMPAIGDPLTYQFILDFDRPGEQEKYDGQGGTTIYSLTGDPTTDPATKYVWAELVSGSLLLEQQGNGRPDNKGYVYRYNDAQDTDYILSSGTDTSTLYVGPGDAYLQLTALNMLLADWSVGTDLSLSLRAYNESSKFAFVNGTLKITDISPVSGPQPVPEPATMLLLGTGLIGLAGYGRRKMKRNKK